MLLLLLLLLLRPLLVAARLLRGIGNASERLRVREEEEGFCDARMETRQRKPKQSPSLGPSLLVVVTPSTV